MRLCIFLLFLFSIQSIHAQSYEEREMIDRYLSGRTSLERLSEIANLLSRNKRLEFIPLYHPLKGKGKTSSCFGMRNHPIIGRKKFHTGIDLAVEVGTSVHVAATGFVIYAGKKGGYGRCVIVRHKYGYETIYAHLIAYNTKKGRNVSQGDVIGFVGSTGRSTGSHLHYEVRYRNKPVKPIMRTELWNKK